MKKKHWASGGQIKEQKQTKKPMGRQQGEQYKRLCEDEEGARGR